LGVGRNTHGHRGLDWIGLDWVSQLVDWVVLELAKWTHVQLRGMMFYVLSVLFFDI